MDKKIKNLFNTEEWIVLNLSNMSYQVKLYLQKLDKLKTLELAAAQKQEIEHFAKVFNYYRDSLIPALQEVSALEVKHLALVEQNPDPAFQPIKMEVKHQRELMNQFINRFEQVHQDFYAFIKVVQKADIRT